MTDNETLTITDNRTQQSYTIPIYRGTVRAMDLRHQARYASGRTASVRARSRLRRCRGGSTCSHACRTASRMSSGCQGFLRKRKTRARLTFDATAASKGDGLWRGLPAGGQGPGDK